MLISNEHEAAAFLLYSSIAIDGELTDHELGKVANIIVYCKKFQGVDLKSLITKFFLLKATKQPLEIIEQAAPLIPDDFKKTLFAMLCDLLCSDGETSQLDINLFVLVGNSLKLPKDDFLPIAYAFMDRYAWNHRIA